MARCQIGFRGRDWFAGGHRRHHAAIDLVDPLASLLRDIIGRRDRLVGGLVDFMAKHGRRHIRDLSPEESRELFGLLLARERLDGETRVLGKIIGKVLHE
jgi:hypothetical protein